MRTGYFLEMGITKYNCNRLMATTGTFISKRKIFSVVPTARKIFERPRKSSLKWLFLQSFHPTLKSIQFSKECLCISQKLCFKPVNGAV